MNIESEKIKIFLLETVEIENNRTLKKQLLYFRNGSILCLVAFMWLFYWATFNSDNANTGTKIIFILSILLTIIKPIFTFKKHQYKVMTWKVEDDLISTPYKDKSLYGTIGGVVTAIIILLYNNIDFSETLVMIFVITAMILGLLVSIDSTCIYQHRLYLLKKYCPEIKDLKSSDIK